MKTKLVFWTAFNSYRSHKLLRGKPLGSPHPTETLEWTEQRVDLFRRFTLPSILNQSYEDFYYIVLLDPYLKYLTKPLLPKNPDPRVFYCYRDAPMLERLKYYDEIVLALIDGDDMYSRDAGGFIMGCPDEWMYFRHGYAYNLHQDKLWTYDTIGSGPFFARRIDPKLMTRLDRDKRHPTHKAVINKNPTMLPDGNFCVLLHGENTSSHPGMRYILAERKNTNLMRENFSYGL